MGQCHFPLVRHFNTDADGYACEGYLAVYNDWRLANRKELQRLLDFSTFSQALPPGYKDVFPRLQTGVPYFWSSTTQNHCNGTDAFSLEPYGQILGGRIYDRKCRLDSYNHSLLYT
ncbi:MAG: DUF1566 domain-containing protein [Desulfobulbaceae bacterium]|nr:DUF1566 domain-containing protein [Desulfobulbaceae bacterium]